MGAKVLMHMDSFRGKPRAPGDIISDEELGHLTPQSRDSLVTQGLIEIEGYGPKADQAKIVALGEKLDTVVGELAEIKAMLARVLEKPNGAKKTAKDENATA
jgi:hypothetical protein